MDQAYLLSLSHDDFTRMKIVSALKEEMASKPFRKVSVSALCSRADVARSTFYRLFADLDDVVSWELARVMKLSRDEYPMTIDWRQSTVDQNRRYFELLLEDRAFYQQVHKEMSHADYGATYLSTQRHYREEMLALIRKHAPECADALCEFQVDFFMYGASNSIASWAAGGMVEAPDVLAESLMTCVPARLEETLNKAVSNAMLRAGYGR